MKASEVLPKRQSAHQCIWPHTGEHMKWAVQSEGRNSGNKSNVAKLRSNQLDQLAKKGILSQLRNKGWNRVFCLFPVETNAMV